MSDICELIRKKRIYFDGGLGTMLQKRGLKSGDLPELWNLKHPDIIEDIHRQYLDAGANIITTNTFGVNCLKHENYDELIVAAIDCAKRASLDYKDAFIAFDIGPIGKFLKPIGDLDFEAAIEIFAKNIRIAQKKGIDLVIIETMTDSYETKAAVLAAKENCDLPIFVTNVYGENGKTLTGSDPEAMITLLEGLGVDAIGMNCSLGPDRMLPLIKKFTDNSSLPIIANPNAGLPETVDGDAFYSMTCDAFSDYALKMANEGVHILGGCCGTDPSYIKAVVEKTRNIPVFPIKNKNITAVSSYTHSVKIGCDLVLVGERINPTGKSKLKQALKDGNISYIIEQGLIQADQGAHILDINVGLPDIDEESVMQEIVVSLQSVCDLPLQIDSNDPAVLEYAMRAYNGKPLINSVNGDEESMSAIFPLVKKYGGTLIALTLDKKGIPNTAEGRIAIAERILDKARKYGIQEKDIIFDPLALTISSDPQNAQITLKTIQMLSEMGLKTSLGISNISFGLPHREIINSSFFSMALERGLSLAIMNPASPKMMDTYYAYRALTGLDVSCKNYIDHTLNLSEGQSISGSSADMTLKDAIIKGISDIALTKINDMIKIHDPLDIINNEIIPALDQVGLAFEKQSIFLPQLLMSAECSSKCFSVIKEKTVYSDPTGNSVILATVMGDIHDIGKNIVKLLLESYGFTVYDLGKDVPAEAVLEAVKKYDCKLVALSALMTTTLPAMKHTVDVLHKYDNSLKVIVGGAVVNEEYAANIGADAYAKDAMGAVRYAEKYYSDII